MVVNNYLLCIFHCSDSCYVAISNIRNFKYTNIIFITIRTDNCAQFLPPNTTSIVYTSARGPRYNKEFQNVLKKEILIVMNHFPHEHTQRNKNN